MRVEFVSSRNSTAAVGTDPPRFDSVEPWTMEKGTLTSRALSAPTRETSGAPRVRPWSPITTEYGPSGASPSA